MARLAAGLIFLVFSMAQAATPNSSWPQFRGPDSSGVAEDDPRLPDCVGRRRTTSSGRLRSQASVGPGPIVWEKKVFVTTAVAQGETEPVKTGLYPRRGAAPDRGLLPLDAVVSRSRLRPAFLWERSGPRRPRQLSPSISRIILCQRDPR